MEGGKMKRKFLAIVLSVLCLSMISACLVSCGAGTSENEPKYTLSNGEAIPASIDVEIGSLCIVPKVVNGVRIRCAHSYSVVFYASRV